MTLIQGWSIISSFLLLLLTIKTLKFKSSIDSLKDVRVRLPANQNWPKISFIVPACNEGETIRTAAKSLLEIDYPNLEVVMVNDRSIDDTGKIMDQLASEDRRLKVIHIKELPKGWLGKVHALNKGIESTRGEWILLADADIHFNVDAMKKAVTYCHEKSIDFLTAVPDIRSKSPVLQTLIAQLLHQASLFFHPQKLNDPKQRTCYGQGAFMLLRRVVYEKSEGMKWLRMEAIDDTGLAVMMRRAGARMGAVSGKDEISLEWYPGVMAYIKGVEKNAFAFCQYNWFILLGMCVTNWLLVLGFTLAPAKSDCLGIQIFCVFSLASYLLAIRQQMKKLIRLRFSQICFFPVAIMVMPLVFIRAAVLVALNKGIYWRGTFYSIIELKANQRMKLANLIFSIDERDIVSKVTWPVPEDEIVFPQTGPFVC